MPSPMMLQSLALFSLVCVGHSFSPTDDDRWRDLLQAQDDGTLSPTAAPTDVESHPCWRDDEYDGYWENRFSNPGKCVEYDHDLTWANPKKDGAKDQAICKHVIDYEYYLDDSASQLDYELYARWEYYNSTVSSLVIPLTNAGCLKAYKKVFCANHFRRCIMKNGVATPLPVCRSEADEMLTYSSAGGICEQVYVGVLGERAIIPVVLASGDDFYYSIWSNPTLTRVYGTAAEEKAHTEENPTCSRINPVHSKYGEWQVQSTAGKYNGTLCKGIIDEYFVPSGLVHPLQPPGLAEDVLEGKARNISLEGLLDPITPLIMPTECQSEWKKWACSTAFMPAALTPIYGEWGQLGVDYSSFFQGTSSYVNGTPGRDNRILAWLNMPRFLHQDQCQTLMKSCKRFIDYVQQQRKDEGEEPIDICGKKIEGVGSAFDGKDQFPNVTMFPLISLGGPTVPNCKRVDILSGGLQVELKLTVFTETRILDYPPFDTVVRQLGCPYPLVEVGPGTKYPKEEKQGVLFTGCAIPCPQPFWPYYYHVAIKWYLCVIAWICFICITYTCATFLYFKRLRKQRQTLIFSGCTWMLCFSQCLMTFWSADFHHICNKDNLDTIEQYDGLTVCSVQSIILMYFATGCTYWWLLVAIDLFMKVHNKMKHALQFKTQIIIAQGCPLLFLGWFSFWSALGNQGLHLCWVNKLGVLPKGLEEYGTIVVRDGQEVYTVNNIDKPWYFIIMINLVVGLLLMVGTIYRIAAVDNKAASKKTTSSTKKKDKGDKKMGARQKQTIKVYMKKWRLYKTSVYFVCLYVGLFITVCCYRFIEASDDNQEAVRESAREWARCLFSNFPYRGYDAIEEGDCKEGPEHKPAIVFMAVTMTFVICLGFGMYAIYGSKSEYVKLWKNELAAKGLLGAQSSVRNASNVNGTICSSRAGDEGGKKKKKKGFFANNSVMSSGRVSGASGASGASGGSSAMSSGASTSSHSSGSTVEDSKPDPSDYIPPRHILNTLKKKEKEILKYDKTCGVYAQTEAVEEVREDKTSFTVHIGATEEWAEKVPEFLEATDGAVDDLRNTLYIMTKACSFPELQGWMCSKFTYDPLKGAVFLKPIIEAQDRTQALLGVKYHWHSGDFLWIKQKSDTRVECFKLVAEEIEQVAHVFDPTPFFEECKNMSLGEVHKMYRAVCEVDISCPYWT